MSNFISILEKFNEEIKLDIAKCCASCAHEEEGVCQFYKKQSVMKVEPWQVCKNYKRSDMTRHE